MYRRQIYQIAESNRNFFCPSWNALVCTLGSAKPFQTRTKLGSERNISYLYCARELRDGEAWRFDPTADCRWRSEIICRVLINGSGFWADLKAAELAPQQSCMEACAYFQSFRKICRCLIIASCCGNGSIRSHRSCRKKIERSYSPGGAKVHPVHHTAPVVYTSLFPQNGISIISIGSTVFARLTDDYARP